MYCRYCGAELKDDENICTNCWQPDEGDPVPRPTSVKTCKKCGAVLKKGATFCGKCGEEASVNSTAKVTAVAVQPSATPPIPQPAPANICKKCGATLKEDAVFCGKCAERVDVYSTHPASDVSAPPLPTYSEPAITEPETPASKPSVSLPSITASDISTTLKKPKTVLLGHTLLSAGYVIYQFASLIIRANKAFNDYSFGDALSVGLEATLMKPHLILMALAAVFSVVGLFMKRPWTYLTSAIIQTVAALIVIGFILMIPLWLIIMAALIVLGFVAYNHLKKGKV